MSIPASESSALPSYVSSELTHFVGAGEPSDEDRFQLFVKILREGKLLDGRSLHRAAKRPVSFLDVDAGDGTEARQNYFAEPYFDTDLRADLESNDFVRPDMVCFCDIPHKPPGFFRIHTAKYNRFGIAFARSFLVRQGACPVFYVARSAATSMRLVGDTGPYANFYLDDTYPSLFGEGMTRGRLFTDMALRILEAIESVGADTQHQLHQYKRGVTDPQVPRLSMYRSLDLPITLFAYLFGYMKFFDPELPGEHPDNFYMEREWRVLGQVSFGMSDIARVFVPPEYVSRLKETVTEYTGSILGLPTTGAG
ncbi:MAG TPA: abortive infection system antitoxin AbiGi family protein [Thermoanaerobaculia bacterium]|jgi:hypothetical protein|nr:abortive infection system antitoxin AbiGi family protein [Thermoanaerobaculia bacterium]